MLSSAALDQLSEREVQVQASIGCETSIGQRETEILDGVSSLLTNVSQQLAQRAVSESDEVREAEVRKQQRMLHAMEIRARMAGDDEQQTMVDMQRLRRVKGLTEAQERIDALRSELGGAPVDEPETRLDVIARGGNTSGMGMGMGMGMGTQGESLSSSNPHRGD